MDETVRHITGSEWARIIAKAWVDEEFRNALELDPINTIHNDPDVSVPFNRLLNLPSRPNDISDEKLSEIAQGEKAAVVVPYTCITF